MLAEERFSIILSLLGQKRSVTVQELCEALDASESTVRRDLTILDRQGRLNKVHGGATLPEARFLAEEPSMAMKEEPAVPQKQSIARAAAALREPAVVGFIDAWTTTLELVRALGGAPVEAGFVTNGLAHARLLVQKGRRVWLLGGTVRPNTEAVVGANALLALQQYNFTKAFMGVNGISLNAGYTTIDAEEAAVKATAVRRARECWFLADDSKFGRVYPAVIAELHDGAILTNRCPNPKYTQHVLVKETQA